MSQQIINNKTMDEEVTKKSTEKGIFWLASYPKSGNTWTRCFISAVWKHQRRQRLDALNKSDKVDQGKSVELKFPEDDLDDDEVEQEGLIDINALNTGAIAGGREWVEQILGFDLSDLNLGQVDQLRPAAYRWYAEIVNRLAYHKMHDAYTYQADGTPLIPPDATRGALCIVRNPFDVAISYANHASISIDQSIQFLANPKGAFCDNKFMLSSQLRQWLLSWSGFVSSWDGASGFDKKTVRYEDMHKNGVATFIEIARFLQLPHDQKFIEEVLEEIKIEKFQAQEAKHGFNEKAAKVEKFFRKGIVGDWQDVLTTSQILQIIETHHDVMQQFGYLDQHGKPTELICQE